MRPIFRWLRVRKWLLLAGVGLLVAAGLGARAGASWWSERRYEAAAREIVGLIALPPAADFHTKVDAVRAFVNDHSRHVADAEFYADWRTPYVMAEKVVAHARGLRARPAHMECSTRTALVSAVLRAMGFATRRIDIYDAATLNSHSFLEVRNPDTGSWEAQDPDYDIFWRRTSSAERISILEVAGRLDDAVPCGRTGCGWSISSREGIQAKHVPVYLDFIVVRERAPSRRYTVYTEQTDPAKVYTHRARTGTFCEVLAKNCRDGFFPIGAKGLAEAL
ncbi:MAG TPA: hypothetical protein VNK52_08750 [Hyphomicrobiaceae bacterium]|nr:hypothetical protein [Hyphomicrobiaceae bacterium]